MDILKTGFDDHHHRISRLYRHTLRTEPGSDHRDTYVSGSRSHISPKISFPSPDSKGSGSPQDGAITDLESCIKTQESVRDLLRTTGNHNSAADMQKKINELKKKLQEMKAAPMPPVISEETKAKIGDYIRGLGEMPADLDDSVKEKLELFRSLVVNGVHFTTIMLDDLSSEEAFCRLITIRNPGTFDQIGYQSIEDNKTVTATLRPDYLKALDHFVKYSKKGFVFYRQEGQEHIPVLKAREFVTVFKNNPEGALVRTADGRYMTAEEAVKTIAEQELRGMILESTPGEQPEIIEADDMVVIGGVVLQKRKE